MDIIRCKGGEGACIFFVNTLVKLSIKKKQKKKNFSNTYGVWKLITCLFIILCDFLGTASININKKGS